MYKSCSLIMLQWDGSALWVLNGLYRPLYRLALKGDKGRHRLSPCRLICGHYRWDACSCRTLPGTTARPLQRKPRSQSVLVEHLDGVERMSIEIFAR